ncbi:unnamed protein product [Effrenium voratum]|nr:unnamed protein product [Effrenium voratum]
MQAFKLPDQELCTEEHADSLSCVAAKGDDPTMYIAAAAGRAVRSHSTSVGLACWTSSEGVVKDGLRCALLGAEVVALAFLPGRSWLAGAVNSHAGAVCCVWNLSDSGCARLSCEVPLEGSSVRCLAIGYDSNSRPLEWRDGPNSPRSPSASARGRPRTVSKDPREAKEPRLKVKRLWHAGLLMPSGLEPFPSAVLASSSDACVVAHEVRTGFRTFFDISQEGEAAPKKGSTPLAATVLRFTASGRLLAAGDTAGRVHLFLLGRLVSSESSQMRVQAHRVLCLSGEVMDIVIKGEQLSRAVCCQSQREQEEQDANDTSAASAGASHDEHRVLVYDLLNPSLDFMLPDVKLKAEDATRNNKRCSAQASSAFYAQLEMMPTLLHQQLPGLGQGSQSWTLLHCCACRGQASQARLLVRLSASPFQRDAKGRNVLDVALQHNEFGVVEDLLAVLMEQRSAECGSHPWDRHGEDVEVLGRALLARSLPAEHLSLTRTVVRLLKMRTATLPEFLDRVCCGVPGHFEVTRAGERLKALPARAALQEKEMKIRSYSAPVYRPDAPEFRLVPSFEDHGHFYDASTPERPVEINVWYLRGALDDEVGLIPALQESDQEEMMRTNFVHVLLEEQWTTVGRRQFRVELALYLVYMACFAGFCMAGRGSCPPPETLAEDFQSFSGASAPGFRLCICPKFGPPVDPSALADFATVVRVIVGAAGEVLLALYQLFFLYVAGGSVRSTLLPLLPLLQETHGLTHGWWERLRALLSYFTTWNNLDMMRIALVTTAIVWSIVDREGAGWLGIGLAVLGRPFLRGVAAWLQHGALTDETLSS